MKLVRNTARVGAQRQGFVPRRSAPQWAVFAAGLELSLTQLEHKLKGFFGFEDAVKLTDWRMPRNDTWYAVRLLVEAEKAAEAAMVAGGAKTTGPKIPKAGGSDSTAQDEALAKQVQAAEDATKNLSVTLWQRLLAEETYQQGKHWPEPGSRGGAEGDAPGNGGCRNRLP